MADARDPLDASALLSCHDAVMRLAARLTFDPNVADDIAQQAMLQMLRAPPRAGPGLRSFLAKVVANVATNFRLADSRRVARERAAASPEPLPPTADLVAQLSAHKDVVDELLRLEEPARTIVFLRFFRDEKPRAIAERLGEPVATIETRLRRALARLRERLDARHGGDRAAWVGAALPTGIAVSTGSAAVATAGGATLMGAKTLGWAAAAVVVVGLGAWIGNTGRDAPRTPSSMAQTTLERGAGPAVAAPPHDAPRADVASPPRRTATIDATAPPERSELVLRSPDGAIARNVSVGVTQHGVLVADGTDAHDGVIALGPLTGAADVFVAAEDLLVTRLPAEFAPGRRVELTLPRGAPVTGHVLVDGRLPTEPIVLSAVLDAPIAYPSELRADVLQALGAPSAFQSELQCVTRAGGAFALFGQPHGVGVRIAPAESMRYRIELDAPKRAFDVVTPAEGVLLRLRENPALRGRIVDGAGVAVPDAAVTLAFADDEPGTHSLRVVADERGRFALWLAHADGRPLANVQRAAIAAMHVDHGHVRRELAGDLERGRDVGDLVLEPARCVRVRVVDEASRPILGARLYASRDDAPLGEPSGADGAIDALVADSSSMLRVAAVGYDIASFALPDGDAAPRDVVLRAATALRIVVLDAHGEPLPDARVRIRADLPLWSGAAGLGVARLAALGPAFESALLVDASASSAHGEAIVQTADDGEVVVRRIRDGLSLRIAVDDPFVGVLAETTISLRAGAEERVEFRLTRTPRLLRGRVVDRREAAVAGALIVFGPRAADVGARRTADLRAETDANGAFALPSTWLTRGALWIVRPGYGATLARDVVVPEHGEPLTFVVDDERIVRVAVVDANGGPLSGLDVDAVPLATGYETLGGFVWGDEVETGVYELRGLGPDLVRIRATIAGATKELVHDPAAAHATLVVPVLGALEIEYALTLDARFAWQMWIESVDDPARGFSADAFVVDPAASSGRVAVPAVLPGAWRVLLQREQEDGTFTTVLACDRVDVRAGQTARVALR